MLLLSACHDSSPVQTAPSPKGSVQLKYEIKGLLPHRTDAFTQGLIFYGGHLYESTGRYGKSSLSKIAPGGRAIERETKLPDRYFGEGLAKVGNELIQLTWKSGNVFRYDLESLEQTGQNQITGEGWGLTFDGEHLINSDGSETLYFRNPQSLAIEKTIAVNHLGRAIKKINEMEIVEGLIAANVFQTSHIIFINPANGEVAARLDLRALVDREEGLGGVDVLNGIAYDPEERILYITGKLWHHIYQLELTSALPPIGGK